MLITLTKIVAVSFCVERWIWLLRKEGGCLNWFIDILLQFRSHFTVHHLSLPGVCMHPAHHFAQKINNNQCLLIINHYCPNNSALQYYNSRFSNNTVLGNTCVTIVSPKMWKFEVNISLLQFSPVSSWTALERGKNDRFFIKSQVTYARGSFQTWLSWLGKSQKGKTTFPFISRDWIWKVHSKASKMRKCSSFQCNPTEHNASMQLERGCFMVAAAYLYKFSSLIFPPDCCSNLNICNHAAPGFLT